MQGDFSRWDPLRDPNRAGVLHQQGRVLLDRDWNDQTRIATLWQDTAARDVIGTRVAAIPSSQSWAFRVERAEVVGGQVIVTVRPGRAWADGLMVTLPRAPGDTTTPPATVQRVAPYLDGSVQAAPGSVGTIGANVRDAVILEVWRESLSAFQLPGELLEPALGGPDTTERILTSFRFRLARLGANEDCHTVALDDRPRGRLRATLRPATVIGGDCPVPDDGGFTGFEHQLYRVEVARVDAAGAWFKHSRFNGGLVARGLVALGGPTPHFTLTANDLPVRTAGQTGFYLEVVRFEPTLGAWTVVYGAEVELDGDDLNVVGAARLTSATTGFTLPDSAGPNDPGVFFRLWDGLRPVTDFPSGMANPPGPNVLASGIRLEFPDPAAQYRPGDFWTFPVRAGGLANPQVLVDSAPPEGIVYHRVPLAELEWANATGPVTRDDDTIEDCRHVFRPLTDQDCCCTFTVGDGVGTHGDFDDVQEAIDHLPFHGGKVCLLPGIHHVAARIVARTDVEISGCGSRTLVVPVQTGNGAPSDPLFLIAASRKVYLHHLTLVTNTGTAVRIDDADPEVEDGADPSAEIRIEDNRIVAGVHAIEARPRNDVGGDNDLVIARNLVGLLDTTAGRAAILVSADGVLIERNRVVVVPERNPDDPSDPRDPETPDDPTFDPCADLFRLYGQDHLIVQYAYGIFVYVVSVGFAPRAVYRALGGIQVVGGSERVRILENEVVGGRGHGVTLAELPRPGGEGNGGALDGFFFGTLTAAQLAALDERFDTTVYDLEIDRNVIRDMGMCGIGVAAFFPQFIVVADGRDREGGFMVRADGLVVSRNRIERCLRDPQPIPQAIRFEAALGGIALADVSCGHFVDNRIEENGQGTLFPLCGLFVLSGDRVEVEGNSIYRNGPGLGENDGLDPGWRAGVVVAFAMSRAIDAFTGSGEPGSGARDGLPAVRVVNNVVSMPIGQALVVGAIGPVAITGNSLTALDIDFNAAPLTVLAGTVLVLDLGLSKDLLFTMVFFSAAGKTSYGAQSSLSTGNSSAGELFEALALLPSGGVLFADNQVTLDLRGRQFGFALCSVLVASLDDIGFTGNQSEITSYLDVVLVDAMLVGVTARAADNRWQEGISLTFYSLFAWAMMNTVTMNQSTHCLLVGAPSGRKLDFGNQVWLGTTVSPLGFRTCGEGRGSVDPQPQQPAPGTGFAPQPPAGNAVTTQPVPP
jgi:hypothetical protein